LRATATFPAIDSNNWWYVKRKPTTLIVAKVKTKP